MITNIAYLTLIAGLVGAVSGYLGSFMVLKRMSLVGDALSHVALPGIALAIMFGINPMLGAFLALALAIFAIWYLETKSEIYPEAIVGVFFTASLAIGLLITPEPDLFEALFGSIENITRIDGLAVIVLSITIFIILKTISKKLTLGIISEDLAKSQKINTSKLNLVYLLLVGLVVAMGVKFLGTLLTGALVIIPAAASKNVSKSIKNFQVMAIVFGVISCIVGLVIAQTFSLSSGPVVVLTSVAIFALSFIFKK